MKKKREREKEEEEGREIERERRELGKFEKNGMDDEFMEMRIGE